MNAFVVEAIKLWNRGNPLRAAESYAMALDMVKADVNCRDVLNRYKMPDGLTSFGAMQKRTRRFGGTVAVIAYTAVGLCVAVLLGTFLLQSQGEQVHTLAERDKARENRGKSLAGFSASDTGERKTGGTPPKVLPRQPPENPPPKKPLPIKEPVVVRPAAKTEQQEPEKKEPGKKEP